MQQLAYFLLRAVSLLFQVLPYRAMYLLSDGLTFLLYRVVGYRRKVITNNLERAFPEKTAPEIQAITRTFYRNLTDILLETLKSFTMPIAEATRRCTPVNPELVNQYLDRNQPVILVGSHLGNWEYGGLSLPPSFHGATITAFKPLSNKRMERYLNWARSRSGMEMMGMEETFRVMRKRSGEAAVFILLADQSPSSRKSAHWVSFFGQQTASLPGADVLGRKFGYPVLYYRTVQVRRGFYEIAFEEICANPATMKDTEITQEFARLLEADIRRHPAQWLWSHRRWKMKPE